jgi:hypothetical protein
MAFSIPNREGQIRQINRGDVFGELNETFNIDLSSSLGKIKTSQRLKRILTEAQLSGPSGILDILIWNSLYIIITEDELFQCNVANDPTNSANWSKPSITEDFDLASTAVVFNGELRISLNTNIGRWNGASTYASNWWTADISGEALTTGKPHVLHVHRGGQETLFVTDDNKVRYYNATAGHTSLTLQTDLVACCVDSGISAIWVGTYNETSGNALVYEMYVGETVSSGVAVSRNAYPVDGRAVLALWVKDNIPYIVTERGRIQAFNGAGFTTVAEFPFAFTNRPLAGVLPGLIQDSSRSRAIHPRGVKTHNDSTFLLINTNSAADVYATNTRSHSGVWELDHSTGILNHRHALADSATDYGASSLDSSGPLLIADTQNTFLLVGVNSAPTNDTGVYATTSETNQGWFITPEIGSGTIQDSYQRVIHMAKTLGATDSINTLYRTRKRDTVRFTGNWLNSTTLTSTADLSSVQQGELIRISHGYASGEWAVIESIETSALTYTLTLNRAIGLAGQTSYVYSDNFQLIDNPYTLADGEYKAVGVGEVNPWIQYMVILKGPIEYRRFESIEGAKTQRG